MKRASISAPDLSLSQAHWLLLRAALAHDDSAVDAWRAWRTMADIDHLDRDAQWLLPQLYENLRGRSLPARTTARYRNVYAHHWYRNQLLLREARMRLDEAAAGAAPILLHAAAVAVGYAGSVGARPLESVPCLAAPLRAAAARAHPTASGLSLESEALGAAMDDRLVADAVPVALHGRQVRVPSAPHMLVLVCRDGDVRERRSRLLWLADVGHVLRALQPAQWAGARALAARLGMRDRLDAVTALVARLAGIDLPGRAPAPPGAHRPVPRPG